MKPSKPQQHHHQEQIDNLVREISFELYYFKRQTDASLKSSETMKLPNLFRLIPSMGGVVQMQVDKIRLLTLAFEKSILKVVNGLMKLHQIEKGLKNAGKSITPIAQQMREFQLEQFGVVPTLKLWSEFDNEITEVDTISLYKDLDDEYPKEYKCIQYMAEAFEKACLKSCCLFGHLGHMPIVHRPKPAKKVLIQTPDGNYVLKPA